MLRFLLAIIFIYHSAVSAQETCSRVANVNYQEILVDSNQSQKGEGLRFYLQNDEIAKGYLDSYQKNSARNWPTAALGTLGTGVALTGIFMSDDQLKQTLLLTGGAMLLVNFLFAKTLMKANETNLIKAIEEYNKRNLPKIQFDPTASNSEKSKSGVDNQKLALNYFWNY